MDVEVIVFSVSCARSQQGHRRARVSEENNSWTTCWEIKSKSILTDCFPCRKSITLFRGTMPVTWRCKRHRHVQFCNHFKNDTVAEARFDTHIHTTIFFITTLCMLRSGSSVRANYSSHVTWSRILCSAFQIYFVDTEKTESINFLPVFWI